MREREKQREEVREGWRGKRGRKGVCVFVCIHHLIRTRSAILLLERRPPAVLVSPAQSSLVEL